MQTHQRTYCDDPDPGTPMSDRIYTEADRVFFKSAAIADLFKRGWATEHSPGFTYIATVPSGVVKIGYSENLRNRLAKLSKQHGGRLLPMAVLPGGYTQEQCLHYKFNEYRLPVHGELFSPSQELLAFALSSGFCEESLPDLEAYKNWDYNKWLATHLRILANKEARAALGVR